MLSCPRHVIRNVKSTKNLRISQKLFSPQYSTATVQADLHEPKQKVTFGEKVKEIWNGPNFKYWFLGTTAFFSWMTYYGLKSYKKACIHLEMNPGIPSHMKWERSSEVNQLLKQHASQISIFNRTNIKKLFVYGATGAGKTILINDFVICLCKKQSGSHFSLPKSNINVFIQCDSEASFLMSLKTFAAKLKIKLSELEERLPMSDTSFATAPFDTQCQVLLECIKESVKKHSGWIFVFDHIQSTTSPAILNIMEDWFINGDKSDSWNSGTVIFIQEGLKEMCPWNLDDQLKYKVEKSLSMSDSCQLLKSLVNVDDASLHAAEVKELIGKVYCNPLGIVCVSFLLKEKLKEKEVLSIEQAVKEVLKDIERSISKVLQCNDHLYDFITTHPGMMLTSLETVVAMVTKYYCEKSPYLQHGFDLVASLKPNIPVPQSLIGRHLRSPFFHLPPLTSPASSMESFFNKQKNDLETVKHNVDEFEPKGKVWSNKNLAEYIRKVEDFFATAYNTVKEIYNLVYGELPPLPEKQDGLDMFRTNEILMRDNVVPGDGKAVTMHPLIYNAVRQHFLASTVYNMESEHLLVNQIHYQSQPWYKRLGGFSEQACLQKFRSSAGHLQSPMDLPDNPDSFLFRYNMGIDISSVYFTSPFLNLPEKFWLPQSENRLRYLQSHISRVVSSLCEEISVTKDDVNGRLTKKILLLHLEYVLSNQPRNVIGDTSYVEGLQTLASCYFDLYKDFKKSKQILEDILKMQKAMPKTNSLDIGKTLTKIADIHNVQGEYKLARSLLEQAAEFYENDRRKVGEYKRCFEFGKLLGLLGVVYASLDLKAESKEVIERSLMLKQATPPDTTDEGKSKQFGSDFASSLTDLGHSYVSLGLPLYGKKILDLALAAHKNLNGDHHPEVVRTLTVLAVAHLMQGHNEESKKLRREAGKLQAALNAIPAY